MQEAGQAPPFLSWQGGKRGESFVRGLFSPFFTVALLPTATWSIVNAPAGREFRVHYSGTGKYACMRRRPGGPDGGGGLLLILHHAQYVHVCVHFQCIPGFLGNLLLITYCLILIENTSVSHCVKILWGLIWFPLTLTDTAVFVNGKFG